MKEKKRAKNKPLPSQQELWQEFNYDSDTGLLIRKSTNKVVKTKSNTSKHLPVIFKGKCYYVHRIIFKMITGRDPAEDKIIEHKKRKRTR